MHQAQEEEKGSTATLVPDVEAAKIEAKAYMQSGQSMNE